MVTAESQVVKALAQRRLQSVVLPRSWRLPIAAMLVAVACADATAQGLACPKSPSSATGRSFQNQNLSLVNFSRLDLTNANFRGAILKGVSFIRANLTGADFSGATFVDTGNPGRSSDFSFARLDSACFIGAKFQAPTYFTYASLTSVDFSQTDLSSGNAIFGDEPLTFDPNAPLRPSFRATVMNCEFTSQWPLLDLTRARIAHCLPQLTGSRRNFSNAMLSGVDLSGQVLDGWIFTQADLIETNLNQASLQGADLQKARLQGAQLNNANLSGATLQLAVLSNDPARSVAAAVLRNAHLRDANLSGAQLQGVDFTDANLYSSGIAAANSACKIDGNGFTMGCASVQGATMDGTTFDGAYLYGLDLTDVTATNVSFQGAVLAGAEFSGATIVVTGPGKDTSFQGAYLQGADLRVARLECSEIKCVNLSDAFVDFTPGGNTLYVQLGGKNHNSFAGCPTTPNSGSKKPLCRQDVCVEVNVQQATAVPVDTNTFTCPDHDQGTCGRPLADGSNRRWASPIDINNPGSASGVPPGWYAGNATYSKASPPQVVCGGLGPNAAVLNW